MNIKSIISIAQILAIHLTDGYYIKPKDKESKDLGDQWNVYHQKLGVYADIVKLLMPKRDRTYTMHILLRFIEENPSNYVEMKAEKGNRQKNNDTFFNIYHLLIGNIEVSRQLLKTSLNFQLNDNDKKSTNDFKRPRRKIAVRMISDIPTERIDELLKILNRQYGIDHSDSNKTQDELKVDYNYLEYDAIQTPMPLSALHTDYMYENLYEDDQDATVFSKTNNNAYLNSFQDFIIQATQAQWN